MGFLDKIKKKISQEDDDLDDLDIDSGSGEDGDDAASDSSGGGALGRAAGLLKRVKKLSSGGEDDDGGGIGGLLGKVKGLGGGKKSTGDSDLDDDDDTALDGFDTPNAGKDDEDGERPIRRSGIAAKPDGDPVADEDPEEKDVEAEIPTPVAAGVAGMDLGSLFEQELVINPTLKDLAESMDEVSALELAADLRTFLEELQ